MALPLPDGIRSVNPYLVVDDPRQLVDFLSATFAATASLESTFDGELIHAEVRIGDATVMIGSSRGWEPATAMLYVYVDDCDAAYARALAAGAESIMEPADMFYGDRHGGVKDPTGNSWWIATHIEDIAPDELARRHDAEQRRRRAAAG
jgi:PhnB protein